MDAEKLDADDLDEPAPPPDKWDEAQTVDFLVALSDPELVALLSAVRELREPAEEVAALKGGPFSSP